MSAAGSETPPAASYEEVRRLMRDGLAEILGGGDPAKLMQDLNDEANELHREALEDIKG